jgi:hypothetical protein
MDVCYLVMATLCFSPLQIQSASYERVDSTVIASADYEGFRIDLVADDGGSGVDRDASRRECTAAGCFYYTHSCVNGAASEVCEYHFQRTSGHGSIFIRATSVGARLPPDWNRQLGFVEKYRPARSEVRVVHLARFERTE